MTKVSVTVCQWLPKTQYIFTNTTAESSHLSSHCFIIWKIYSSQLRSRESQKSLHFIVRKNWIYNTKKKPLVFYVILPEQLATAKQLATANKAVQSLPKPFHLFCVSVRGETHLCGCSWKVQYEFGLTALFILQFLPRWVSMFLTSSTCPSAGRLGYRNNTQQVP